MAIKDVCNENASPLPAREAAIRPIVKPIPLQEKMTKYVTFNERGIPSGQNA